MITRSIADAILDAQQGQIFEQTEEELIEEKKEVELEEVE